MKNKPLDRGSRRLRFVSKLHAQLRRNLWQWAPVGDLCGGGGGSAWRKRWEQRFVWRWWRLGVKEEMRREEWHEGSRGSCEREMIFFFFFWGYTVDLSELWCGVVSLAGVKHWFYASSGPNVFSYPNTQLDLFYSDSSLFWCTAPKYVTNGCVDPSTQLQNTNLKRLLAAKFFSSSIWWRSGRCLVTKPCKYTATSSRERDELGQEPCLRSQFAWTEFAQCLCNLCTILRLLK